MRRRTILWGLCASIAPLCLVLACAGPPGSDDEANEGSEAVAEEADHPLVETMQVNTTRFEEHIELSGETEPIRAADITPETPGRITELELVEGQMVEEGTRVLRVDASLSRSQIDQLRIQRDQLDSDIGRYERLVERGLANSPELEQMRSQRESVDEQIDSAQIGVRQSRTEAPISGEVVETYLEEGEYASPGVPVARIVDISTIVVRVGLPERDIPFAREGMEATVRIVATGEERTGIVTRIGIEADTRNRTFPVEIQLDNTERTIRSGMRATVMLPKQTYENVVVIPRDIVLQGIESEEVVIVQDGVAHFVPVTLGPTRGQFVVVETGLVGGETLIVRGQRSLINNEAVETIPQGDCCAEQLEAL